MNTVLFMSSLIHTNCSILILKHSHMISEVIYIVQHHYILNIRNIYIWIMDSEQIRFCRLLKCLSQSSNVKRNK